MAESAFGELSSGRAARDARHAGKIWKWPTPGATVPSCHRRDYEGIRIVTPADVYYSRRQERLKRRKEHKQATLERRFHYNLGQASNQTWGKPGAEL